jgi:hypothetical protein
MPDVPGEILIYTELEREKMALMQTSSEKEI